MRDLQCSYDKMREMVFTCEWREPAQPYATIKYYHVHVMHNDRIIFQKTTSSHKLVIDRVLSPGEKFTVSVLAVTHTEGEAAETHVNYIAPGMLTSSIFLTRRVPHYPIVPFYLICHNNIK